MNKKIVTSFIALVLLSSACGDSNKSSPDRDYANLTRTEGTGDSAGGNTYKGRPLESYILADLADLPSYKNALLPWIQNISKAHGALANDLHQILKKKVIYLIPGPLDTLPSQKIGSAVRTEQAALQDFGQIWINQEIFNRMTEADQVKLLVHEMLIGLKIFNFDSPHHQCLMTGQTKEVCDSFSLIPSGSPHHLSTADYQNIRSTVTALIKPGVKWTYSLLDQLFFENGFSLMLSDFGDLQDVETVKYIDIYDRFEKGQILKFWPSVGYDWAHFELQNPSYHQNEVHLKSWPWKSHEKCEMSYSKDEKNLNLTLKTSDREVSFNLELTTEIHLYRRQTDSGSIREGSLPSVTDQDFQVGDKRIFADIQFSGSYLSEFHVQEMVCLTKDEGGCGWSYVIGAANYRCSTDATKFVGKK